MPGRRRKRQAAAPRRPRRRKMDPAARASAESDSAAGLRERTEAGHIAAGRVSPSQVEASRQAGATRVIDDSIRNVAMPVTEDEKLLQLPAPSTADFTRTDTWRVLRIMGEFIEGFDTLAWVQKAVTVFGSARVGPDDPQYKKAEQLGGLLANAGFAVITGAGPDVLMEVGEEGLDRELAVARLELVRAARTNLGRSALVRTMASTISASSLPTETAGANDARRRHWRCSSRPAPTASGMAHCHQRIGAA